MIGSALMGTGVGFAFAAMPNLIIEAVRQEQTGEATAVNALVRNVGAAVGAQASGAILAGSVVPGATFPAENGFTTAFVVAAGVAVLASALALFVPGRLREVRRPTSSAAATAGS
jgi:sugar phosphate permease